MSRSPDLSSLALRAVRLNPILDSDLRYGIFAIAFPVTRGGPQPGPGPDEGKPEDVITLVLGLASETPPQVTW
jgi:hypothetical protein